METTRKRKDFGGIEFTANFAHDYPPYSWINSQSKVEGAFKAVVDIITSELNLTFVIKPSKERNKMIWLSK